MSTVVFEAGAYVLLANYIYQKKPSLVWYFRRRIPDDVARHYPGKNGSIRFSLKTKDEREAARKAHQHALAQNALWTSMRTGKVTHGPELVQTALGILQRFDLKPGEGPIRDELGIDPDEFLRELDYQADLDPNGSPEANNTLMRDGLPPEYKLAVKLLYGEKPPFLLSEALKEFQKLKGEAEGSEAFKFRSRVVSDFIALFGDRPIEQYTRDDANHYVQSLIGRGNKTATVKRRLNSISAIFSLMSKEEKLARSNIFAKVNVPKLGEDSIKREPFTVTELSLIQSLCIDKDDEMRRAIAIISDTGARVGEVVGLRTQDVVLDAPIPYVVIQPHSARRVKTERSHREVPLVGAAFWGARQAVNTAKTDFLFPRYIDFNGATPKSKATHASNAFNNWIRGRGINKTCHSFRHSVNDRLRDVGTPSDLRDEIAGWKTKGMGAGYGKGYSLERKAEYLQRIVIKGLFSE